jgi:hypothetical protein
MKIILEHDEELLGRSHCIIRKGNDYVQKYYYTDQFLDDVKFATKLMKMAEPALYVSEETVDDYYIVTQNYIEHRPYNDKPYITNIANYLGLVDSLGWDYSKRDLQHYNIIYYNNDEKKPFIIDWDDYVKLGSKEVAYIWYKKELTSLKWQVEHNLTKEDAENIFDKEWQNV